MGACLVWARDCPRKPVIAALREAPLSLWGSLGSDKARSNFSVSSLPLEIHSPSPGLRTHAKPISKHHLKKGSEPVFLSPVSTFGKQIKLKAFLGLLNAG